MVKYNIPISKDMIGSAVGDSAQVTNIYGDYLQQNPDFVELKNLKDEFQSTQFPSPQITPDPIETIRRQHLLVLGGSLDIDKASLARYLAWRISESLKHESTSGNNNIPIKEWNHSSNPQSIDLAIQQEDERTIFILTHVSPKDVGYNLPRIKDAASRHYVLVSTDTPFASWKLPYSEKPEFWLDLSNQKLYRLEDLVNVLIEKLKNVIQKLGNAKKLLPPALQDKNFEPEEQITDDGLSWRQVAENFNTPNEIARFVELLCAEKLAPKRARVFELIGTAKNNKETIRRWYSTLLEPREQLLALGLSLFDSFFDDQLFAALERVVKRVWWRRDASLRALDYCDLDNLRNFFSFVETKSDGIKIESILPEQRRTLFEIAWDTHRRQMLAALPVIEQLVKDSVVKTPLDQELYGTPARREQVRTVIGDAISDIGLISTSAVEETLLHLAANREIAVQAIAAYAMARWLNYPQYERDKELFKTIDNWQSQARIIGLVNSILKGNDEKNTEEPQDYIRATIALTVGYAAQYYAPQQKSQNIPGLSEELCDLLKKLSDDPNKLVRDRFCFYTLPLVVPLHLVQLRQILHDMTRYNDLIVAVARSLARTYRNNPEEVINTLHEWHSECKQPSLNRVNQADSPKREQLLATVVLTYGAIPYDEENHTLTVDQAFNYLRDEILLKEKHPFVREAFVWAIGNLARRNFEKIESKLQNLVSNLTDKERNLFVQILTEIYLDQRQNQENGDDFIEVNERRYPVWIDSKRQLTDIEEAMFRWIRNDKNDNSDNKAVAQQLATQASVEFAAKLESEEEKLIRKLQAERSRKQKIETQDVSVEPRITGRLQHGFYLDKLVPWWVTRNEKSYELSIRNLLPEGLKHHKTRQEIMDFVLYKWKKSTDNQIRKISDLLDSGFFWTKNLGLLIALGSGSLLTLVGIVAVNISSNLNSKPIVGKPSPSRENIPEGIFILRGANVRDIDSANFNGGKLTVSVTNSTPDDLLLIHNQSQSPREIGIDGSNLNYRGENIGSFQGGKGTEPLEVSFNEKSTPEAAQALLRNIKYTNIAKQPVIGLRKVQFQISDGAENGTSKSVIKDINVIAENQAPSITVPESKTVQESASFPISSINISDPDSKNITLSLAVNDGILTVKSDVAQGLTVKNISNNKAKNVTIVGTIAQIKTTLANPNAIIYQGKKDFSGDDSLAITVKDDGKSISGVQAKSLKWPPNAGKPKTVNSQKINITVTPLKARPVITVPEGKTVNENTNLLISSISIKDASSPRLTVTLSVSKGIISVKDNVSQGLTVKEISNNTNKTVTLTGTVAQINNTLADLKAITYKGDKDFHGQDFLIVAATNDANKTSEDKMSINVTHINQPPEISESEVLTTDSGINITKKEAVALLNKWLQAKRVMFDHPYDSRPATELMTGQKYEQTIGSINSLKQDGNYYKYGELRIDGVDKFFIDGNQVIIQVKVTEDRTLYNRNGNIDPKETDFKTRTVICTLQPVSGSYKIAATKIMN